MSSFNGTPKSKMLITGHNYSNSYGQKFPKYPFNRRGGENSWPHQKDESMIPNFLTRKDESMMLDAITREAHNLGPKITLF